MNMNIQMLRTLACTALLIAGMPQVGAAADGEAIRIPVITPMTGPLAILGQDSKRGAELALEEINAAGGISGRKLSIEIADGQGKPETVRREMERLIKLQKAPMVLGCEGSAGTAVAAQFAEQSRVPLLNATAVSADILKRGYKWYFSEQYTGDDEAESVFRFIEMINGGTLGKLKIALLYEDSPRGAGTGVLLRKMLAERNTPAVAEVSYNRSERNLLPFVNKIQQAAPDLLIWVGYTEDVVAGIKAMQQLDYRSYVIGVGGGPGDPRLPTLSSAEVIARLHLATVDGFNVDLKRAQPMIERYRQKYNTDPSSYVSLCYQAVLTTAAVLKNTLGSGGSITPSDIQKTLRTIVIPGAQTITPFSRIQFDANGRNVGATPLVSQWKAQGSKKSTVWPADVAVTNADPLH
jgi:branched-chain amino acid transport system substrate-binding protein